MSQPSPIMPELIETPDITHPLERLRAGDVFVELRHDDVATRAASLDALLLAIRETETKLVWIGNPLRSPLTSERLLLQAAGAEADLRVERTPDELVAMLHYAIGATPRTLLIVQQPETLDPGARDMLASVAPILRTTTPAIQVLFCGTSAFRPIATRPLAPIRTTRPLSAPRRLAYETIPTTRARTRVKPLLFLLVVAVVGIGVNSSITDAPVQTPVQQPTTIDSPAIRLEFDNFLNQSQTSQLTQEQRNTLFDEFLARQQKLQNPKP